MSKTRKLLIALMLLIAVLLIPNMVNAVAEVESRNFPSNDGTIELNLIGLELDSEKSYQFSLVPPGTYATEWHLITEKTNTTAKINLNASTIDIANALKIADNATLIIKENEDTTNTPVAELDVDLKLPYLQSLSANKDNGKYEFYGTIYNDIGDPYASTAARNVGMQWQKVEDEDLIKEFLDIKNNNKDITNLEEYLPKHPEQNYTIAKRADYTSKNDGLYLLWVKRTGDNCKTIYSCIIHDGLPNATTVEEYLGTQESDTAVESVSLPETKTVELGKTITLTPTFNPSTATNKIVTWESSDETVATVDNAGKVTPKKVGSTIITVTSQDGNKKATCTVTVTANSTDEETKKYISFPYIIYFGTTTIELKQGVYDGDYTMYYQFVEATNENEETKYDDSKWIKMEDRKPAKPSVEYTGEKKFDLWVKLVMSDKTVYESFRYKFNGSTPVSTANEKKTFNNHTYQVIDKLMTWEEAKAYCESLGGYLVTLNSKEEDEFVFNYFKSLYADNKYWIGLYKNSDNNFVWTTGEKLSYTNWGPGEPNNQLGTQKYGLIRTTQINKILAGQWDDTDEYKYYFICEWGELEKETTTNKDTTTANKELPKTGRVLLFWIIGIVAVSGIVAHKRYKKLYM